MQRLDTLRLLADYNLGMNRKALTAAERLPHAELVADRKAFFGSILGTLNHLLVADLLWLHRLAAHPADFPALHALRDMPRPQRLDQALCAGLPQWADLRARIDAMLVDCMEQMREADLDHELDYANMAGVRSRRGTFGLLLHLFNHQTHHRGQLTTLLTQAGVDIGETDLLRLLPDALQPGP